jgi:hypothetical protein
MMTDNNMLFIWYTSFVMLMSITATAQAPSLAPAPAPTPTVTGLYHTITNVATGKVLSATSYSLYTVSYSINDYYQKWYLTQTTTIIQGSYAYNIYNAVYNNYVIDDNNGTPSMNKYDPQGTPDHYQEWTFFVLNNSNIYYIQDVSTELYLYSDMSGNVYVGSNNDTNSAWIVAPYVSLPALLSAQPYTITNVATGQILSSNSAFNTYGAPNVTNSSYQEWYFTKNMTIQNEYGTHIAYTIQNVNNTYVLNSNGTYANVSPTSDSKWIIVQNGDNVYSIIDSSTLFNLNLFLTNQYVGVAQQSYGNYSLWILTLQSYASPPPPPPPPPSSLPTLSSSPPPPPRLGHRPGQNALDNSRRHRSWYDGQVVVDFAGCNYMHVES